MIYDPRRAVLELRQRIIQSMTPDEQEQYLKSVPASVELSAEAKQNKVVPPFTKLED